MGNRSITCLLGLLVSLTFTSAAVAESSSKLELGSFGIGMTFDDWRDEVRVATLDRIQKGIEKSRTGVYADRRRGVQRAYSAAAGAMLFVEVTNRRCAKHFKRVAGVRAACTFWFGKSGADRPYRLFDMAVEFQRPNGLGFDELTAKLLDRFGAPAGDHRIRQPASAPVSRFLRWKVRVKNANFAVYFRGRPGDPVYSLRMSATEPYLGATRYGRHLRRTWVRNLVIFE